MDTNDSLRFKVNWKRFATEFAQATELEEVPAVASDAVIKAKETVEKPVVLHPSIPRY